MTTAYHTRTASLMCHCVEVTESQVQDAVDFHGSTSIRDVIACTGAGAGCTACHRRILGILKASGNQPSEASPI